MLHLAIRRPAPGTVTVRLVGELDCAGVEAVAALVASVADEVERVVLDVSDLSFVDVAGSRALDDAVADLASRGVTAALEGLTATTGRVRDLLPELHPASCSRP